MKEISLEEVVISASNFSEKKKNIAQKIDVITAKSIAQGNAQNTGDLLMNTGKVFLQKSQQGGSSPVLPEAVQPCVIDYRRCKNE